MTRERAKEMLEEIKINDDGLTQYIKGFDEALDMAIKALETLEEFEKAQIITGGRLNGRTYAYKCGLEDGKRKALEKEAYTNIPYLMHKELDIPISDCQKAYDVAIDYLRSQGKLRGGAHNG